MSLLPTISRQKRSVLILVAIIGICSLSACKKVFWEFVGGNVIEEFWEDRPEGIGCTPGFSALTLDNQKVTYSGDHLLCVNLEMEAGDFAQMRNESRFGPSILDKDGKAVTAVFLEYFRKCDVPYPDEYNWYLADLTVDGHAVKDVAIRKKGFLGSIFSTAPAIKIQTDRFSEGASLGQTRNLTFNNNAEDPTRLMQCINYQVFQWADYPAPRCNLATVSINGEALGVYSHLEPIDEDFLIRNFGNDQGHLYEGQLTDLRAEWLPRWDAKTEVTNATGTPLLEIAQVLEEAPDIRLMEELEPHLNLDRFFTFWAMEVLLNHVDGYSSGPNNFFVYMDPDDGDRITFIPWGMNYLNLDTTDLNRHVSAELPRRLSRTQDGQDRFNSELQRLLDEVWDENALDSLVDQYALQVQSGQNDPKYPATLALLKGHLQNRRTVMEELLITGLPEGAEEPNPNCYADAE